MRIRNSVILIFIVLLFCSCDKKRVFDEYEALNGKWKKEDGVPPIVLEATPDILAGLGKIKRPGQVLVGFAAETSNLVANAQGKLERKNLDLIVANDVSLPEVGFGHETNAVTIVSAYDEPVTVDLASKTTIAQRVLDSVEKSLHRIQEHT